MITTRDSAIIPPPIKARAPREPGLLLLQLDGCSQQDLHQAIDDGLMPNMEKWIEEGTLKDDSYRCSMPSATAVSQGAVIYGANILPANQFWIKGSWQKMDPWGDTADKVEEYLQTNGPGGLLQGGKTYMSPLAGGADPKDSHFVYSAFQTAKNEGGKSGKLRKMLKDVAHVSLHLAGHPAQMVRALGGLVHDAHAEFKKHKEHHPDESTGTHLKSALKGAFIQSYLADASTMAMADAMKEGKVPALYIDFDGVDHANHEYADKEWSLQQLADIDRNLGTLMKAAKEGDRRYNMVIFADHGTASGTYFNDLYGQSFPDFFKSILPAQLPPSPKELPPYFLQDIGPGAEIYFTSTNQSMNGSDVRSAYPGVIEKLQAHDATAFVMTREGDETVLENSSGSVVISANGKQAVQGINPLDQFGEVQTLGLQLANMAHRTHAADLMMFTRQAGETMINLGGTPGLHGGPGLGQQSPMLAYSPDLPLDGSKITEGDQLYQQLAQLLPSDSPAKPE
jgi:hypothetical protein